VPSGGTMVIGGITAEDDSTTFTDVPLLGQLPLVGWLFSRDQRSKDHRTLYIFLTPYILYDYSFGDYRDLTYEKKEEIEGLRGGPVKGLSVELRPERLPDSTFRFQLPRPNGKEDER